MAPVLVVDDDADIRAAITLLLQDEGYEPTEAQSLDVALSLLDTRAFALVLTDLFSHGPKSPLNSIATLCERADPTPVGVISGWRVDSEAVAAETRCAFMLRKPFDLDELVANIAQAISTTLTPEQQRQASRVHEYFAALSARDWDRLLALCADDVCYILPGTGQFSQTLSGKAAFREYSKATFAYFPATRFENVRVYATPQGLASRYEARWLVNEQEQRQSGAVVFQFSGDLIRQIGVRLNHARIKTLMVGPDDSSAGA